MKLVKLIEVFEIAYGNKIDSNKTTPDVSGVNFVTRSSKHLGIKEKVAIIDDIDPLEAGLITVTLGGSYLLSAFVQPEKFYTAQNIKVLLPIEPMSFNEKIFYCLCIKANRFKYSSHGREANRSLGDLLVPAKTEIPLWVHNSNVAKAVLRPEHTYPEEVTDNVDALVDIGCIFDVVNGVSTGNVKKYSDKSEGDLVSLVRPSKTQFTSTVEWVKRSSVGEKFIFPKHTLYVSTNGQGSHSYAYVSNSEFVANSDVSVLIPKKAMTLQEKLFYAHAISSNRWLFSYGRKPKGKRLKSVKIPASPPSFVYGQNLFEKAIKISSAFS